MKRILILILTVLALFTLASCDEEESFSFINGVGLSEYAIVYSEDDLDYSMRAAEYIKAEILSRTGLNLPIVKDTEAEREYEIVVGETKRDISNALDADTEGLEFSMSVSGGKVALEGDYFIIAAAAYYFIDTFVPEDDFSATVPEGISVHEPIVKEAKNYIILIGDGMGHNHTKLFDYLTDSSDFSDGEDMFYGYLLPYFAESRTESLDGITDSAAGGSAISCGTKTHNGYVGKNADGENIKSLTELAAELGLATGVMSTENRTGATPASFSAHANDRSDSSDIRESQAALAKAHGTIIDCGFDYYNAIYMKVIEKHLTDTLAKLEKDDDGFFLMYEEAHIDKHSHNNNMEKTYLSVIRFNQIIARVMEHAFYNPDTFVLITADHETGMLLPTEDGTLSYNSDEHSAYNVPIFAYGDGAALFDGKTVENIQIGQTVASFLGVTDFGDQSEFGYLK